LLKSVSAEGVRGRKFHLPPHDFPVVSLHFDIKQCVGIQPRDLHNVAGDRELLIGVKDCENVVVRNQRCGRDGEQKYATQDCHWNFHEITFRIIALLS